MPLAEAPVLSWDGFRESFVAEVRNGAILSAFFGQPVTAQGVRLYGVFSRTGTGSITAFATDVGNRFPSLTPECPQAHWFEREIAEQWGVVPEEHPWLKPIRFHPSYRSRQDAWGRAPDQPILPGVTDYFRVEGEEVHEVAVGPVHAGVIEPGHFRFQCHGEQVFHLEIELGYQHRGVERHLIGGPNKRSIHYAETLAGDTSIGHATAYCQTVESLAGKEPPLRAQAIRAIALELERLANHTGDLGALANDVGYLPTASYCGRLRGDFLNASAAICGSRFGRGLVRPGGVLFDIEPARAEELSSKIDAALRDVAGAARLLWQSASVLARFDETGHVSRQTCDDLGLVGVAARACGRDRDVRRDFPSGYFRFAQIPVATWPSGDVFSRSYVRWLEIQRSCRFIREQLASLPRGKLRREVGNLRPNSLIVSLVEGWRGEICHVAITDSAGQFAHYKVVDPSFHNWIGLAMSLRGQQISDFPLCNKSFNLSYCGHDL
jgi:Ni,Fe-hydrogenase III large subunit